MMITFNIVAMKYLRTEGENNWQVLELTVGSPIREEMKIDNLVEKLFRELTKASKLVPTGMYKLSCTLLFPPLC